MTAFRCLVALLAIGLAATAPVPAATPAPVLTVSSNNTPLDRRALQLLGEEAFRRAGLALQLTALPSERSLVAANTGEVDGEGLRIAGLEARYPNLVRVPERLISVSFVAFARDERITLDNGFASLRPWRVAFIQGWKMYEAEAAGARVVHRVDQAEQLFRMLDHDRIDLALYTLADGQALARHLGLARVRAIVPSLADADMYLYLNRRHEALVPRLAQALRDMKSDGTHARLLAAIGAP
ncbi:MAG: transporter substrate-binding domain-containing protein [Rubrivivax sp.]